VGKRHIVAVVSSIQKSAKLQLFWLIKTEAVGIKHVGFMWRNKKCQKMSKMNYLFGLYVLIFRAFIKSGIFGFLGKPKPIAETMAKLALTTKAALGVN
jgi:hypothetical protein